jgi:hypothetical protein
MFTTAGRVFSIIGARLGKACPSALTGNAAKVFDAKLAMIIVADNKNDLDDNILSPDDFRT